MGTNFYYTKPYNPCVTCGHDPNAETLHIGKSSAGWCFSLCIHPTLKINTLEDWNSLWQSGGSIRDEYGDPVSVEDMIDRITNRQCVTDWAKAPHGYSSWYEFHSKNGSEPGPNGMLRHRIDGFVIAHGEGTWDYLHGYFS